MKDMLRRSAQTGADDVIAAAAPAEASLSAAQSGGRVSVPVIIVLSICSSVCLILTNKVLMHDYGFKAVFLLTATHFLFGGVTLTLASVVGQLFVMKSIGMGQSFMVGAAGVASIGFMNLSLLANTVGTYQLFKLAVIPVVLALQFLLFRQQASRNVHLTLVILLVGVAIATVSDVQLGMLGLVYGIIAVMSTALFNIWQGSKQKEHDVTSTQLLHSIAFYQGVICLGLGLYFEEYAAENPISQHPFTQNEILLLFMSCMFATSVNMCSMGLIGRTSPVTYQVVGHVKTCLVLAGGYLLFPVNSTGLLKNLFGVAVALVGVFLYTYVRLKERKN